MSSIGVAGVLLLSVVFSFVPWIGETSKLPSPLYMSQWGVSGSDSGRFNSPGSIAIGGDNRRYVADRGNVRVQVFDHSNTLIAVIASTAGGLAMDPDDLAVAADSTLFWLEDTGVIQRFDKNHQKINEWTATVDGGTIPGVVFERLAASKNYVFIAVRPNPSSADSNANIIRMAVDGSNIHKFTLEDPAQYQIIMNTDALATDVHDNLYVIMHYRTAPIANSITELRKFSSSGTLLKAWALTNAPHSGLAVDRSGAIYYSNAASNGLIDVIAADSVETSFRFAGGVNTGGALLSPAGLAADSLCGLFVTDGRDRVVQLRIDSDNDGLCDAWERDGIMVRGSAIPLALPAASIVRPDVYVEVDCMSGQAFHAEAKDSVVSAFNRKGITLHVDINETDLPAADWTSYADYDTFKDSYFGDSDRDILAAQKLFLRYCVFARDFHDGDAGKGEYRGNDFFIALHPLVDTLIARGGTKYTRMAKQTQAGVFMHELGHTLGLGEGGGDDVLRKPNYFSVMNYAWMSPTEDTWRKWQLDFSSQDCATLSETLLIDLDGINGSTAWGSVRIGPPTQVGSRWRYRPVSPIGPVDWDSLGIQATPTCTTCDVNRFAEGDTLAAASPDETFHGWDDWSHIFSVAMASHDSTWHRGFVQDSVASGGRADITVAEIEASVFSYSDCNANGLPDADDIAAATSLDVDHNGIPDECDPPRIIALADTVYACPGGDLEAIAFAVDIEGVAVPGQTVESHVRVDTLGGGVRLWREDGRQLAVGDTLHEYLRDTDELTNRLTSYFALSRASGCGYAGWSVWQGDSLVVRDVGVQVISVDQDSHSIGSVDRFDSALLLGASSRNLCWDLDGSGTTTVLEDHEVLFPHLNHHVTRKLSTPNGGEAYTPSVVVPITWQSGYGDSAYVTIRLKREGTGDSLTIVADGPDDGAFDWTVPSSLPVALVSDSTYRMQIIHTAGYYKVDNKDVGSDKSDTTFTIRPRKPFALSVSMARSSAALSWTEAGQAGSNADAYQVADSMQATITDANVHLAHAVAYSASPGDSGTVHCVEIDGLTQCKAYSFAVRTRENGIWSLVSVINGNTTCSGYQVAICDGGGLLADGGGEEEGLRAPGLSTMGSGGRRVHGDEQLGNSVLPGALSEERLDYLALAAHPALVGGAHELLLRQTGGRHADVRQISLGVVDHALGTLAVSSKDGVLVGTGGSVLSVTGYRIRSGSELARGTGESHRTEAGEIVLVDLGQGKGAALLLETRGDLRAASTDSVGILVQRPGSESAWETIETVYPRREFSQTAVPTQGVGQLRLVFLRDYEVRALRKLSDIAPGQLQPLTSLGTVHSRLGGAPDSTSLVPGDSLRLRFSQAETGAVTRDYFLSVRGRYRVAEGQGPAGSMELVASSAPILSFALGAARPNPSSGSVVISYALARDVWAELRIFDVAGREVRTLVSGDEAAGAREAAWDGRDAHGRRVPSGVYFYQLRAGDWRSERKLVVLQK